MINSKSHNRHQKPGQSDHEFLDRHFPLADSSHRDVSHYYVYFHHLCAVTGSGQCSGLKKPAQFTGFNGPSENPDTIELKTGDVHLEICTASARNAGAAGIAAISKIVKITAQSRHDQDSAVPEPADDFGLLQPAF